MADHELAKARQTLEKRLQELDVRIHELESELDVPRSKDWSEGAQESEGDQVMENLGQSGLSEIRAIKAALDRIDNGTYGICTKCGEEISPERLKLVPQTPFCRKCVS